MRTTVTLTPDVRAEVDRLRREEGLGTSEAINRLARKGLNAASSPPTFTQRTVPVDYRFDVSNVADALDLADELDR